MRNPIKSFDSIKESIMLYIETAFGSRSKSFNEDRRAIVKGEGGIFQEPYIEPIEGYRSGKKLEDLLEGDLPGLTGEARAAFVELLSAKLIKFPLFSHQQEMLRKSLEGKHCVVTSGTGSGKTESFLLPLLASIISEAVGWERTRPPKNWQGKWWEENGTGS